MIGRNERADMIRDAEAAGGFWAARVGMLCKALDEAEAARDEHAAESETRRRYLAETIRRESAALRERDDWKASNAELGARLTKAEYERDEAENDAETWRDVSLAANATAREWQRVAAEQTRLERDRAVAAEARAEQAEAERDEAETVAERLGDEVNRRYYEAGRLRAELNAARDRSDELASALEATIHERDALRAEVEGLGRWRVDATNRAERAEAMWQRMTDKFLAASEQRDRYRLAWLSARSRAAEAVAEADELAGRLDGRAGDLDDSRYMVGVFRADARMFERARDGWAARALWHAEGEWHSWRYLAVTTRARLDAAEAKLAEVRALADTWERPHGEPDAPPMPTRHSRALRDVLDRIT